jgi:hypothetical protein
MIDHSKERCAYVFIDLNKPGNYTYGDYSFDYEPYYAGNGSMNRPREHLYAVNKGITGGHYDVLDNLLRTNEFNTLFVIVKRGLIKNEALDIESSLIKSIGRLDLQTGPLYNLSDGGSDGWGYNQKIDKTYMTGSNNWFYGADTTGSKNHNAFIRSIVQSPEGQIYYLRTGMSNQFCNIFKLPNSTFKESLRVLGGTVRRGAWKGWLVCGIPADIDIDESNMTTLDVINLINHLKVRFTGYSFGKYIQVNGNGSSPIII